MKQSRAKSMSQNPASHSQIRADIAQKSLAKLKNAATAKTWVDLYIDAINPEDLLPERAEYFINGIAQLWDAASKQKPGKPEISINMPNEGSGGHGLIGILNDDRPFLVDSTTNELHRMGIEIESIVHPTAYVECSGGKITSIIPPRHLQKVGAAKDSGRRLSFIQFIVRPPSSGINAKSIRDNLARVLADVAAAVTDWPKMRGKLADVIGELNGRSSTMAGECEESQKFLGWLDQDHFTFLGYRAYQYPKSEGAGRISVVANSGLGVIQNPDVRVFGDLRDRDPSSPELRDFLSDKAVISISKSNTLSTVHRAVPMDVISIKRYDQDGRVIGEHRFVGLFTSLSYSRNPRDIPLLRQKVDNIVAKSGWNPSGHKAKILIDVLVSYPRDELFQIEEGELYRIAIGITRIQEKLRTALFLRRDKFGRYYSALIFTPRENFTSNLREKFGRILESRLDGKIRGYFTQLSDQPLARIHFTIDQADGAKTAIDSASVERELAESARSWADRLRDGIRKRFGDANTAAIMERYSAAFSDGYQNLFPLDDALADIEKIDGLLFGRAATPDMAIHIYDYGNAANGECGLALYQYNQQIVLSDILPSLEHLGFRVLSEIPMAIKPNFNGAEKTVWMHNFHLQRSDKKPMDVAPLRDIFVPALGGVHTGLYEDDGFNRLIVTNHMTAREVVVFRAFAKYLRQIGFTVSQDTIERTLAANPAITESLLKLFYALFDPAAKRGNAAKSIEQQIELQLESVSNVEQDRILRKYLNLVTSTLRTNYFQSAADGNPKNYMSFKISSPQILDLPEPKPWCEIFVCSPRVEAVHLRGGKVARGGIRWSDRLYDFRTEVLGLVKAQMVKNTVIVPVGSKGGFVLKQPPAGRAELAAEVTECYKTMMRGLLDITDNLKNGKIVPPANVVRRDGDDPYLVVAADKGTAKFSDTANSVSAEYGFWLGDAFASGGSAGYDHKELAITARGGWVSVLRHFREMGVDIRKIEFTAVGVGDMAGDVFGNGMLQSDKMKLIAAFNHSHIFIDPNPDPKKSFAERKRLFENPSLTWADYNAKLISKGGGVFTRDAKKISVTPEMKKAIGIDASEMTPAQLIQSILKSSVDLIWFGGIGTFVKSTRESHADAGDRANDALRVNGADIRAKIVGEGANLGFTQLGRVEYALAGGRNNTDAIDNSGGVDTSDHEVNIKILLSIAERDGRLTRPNRNTLLRSMRDDVCALVLNDNYEQSAILSVMQTECASMMDDYTRQLRHLERGAKLSRAIEYLPSDEELAERQLSKRGLTRPELAVMLSYTKMAVYDAILASNVPDDPHLTADLMGYFPAALRKKYAGDIERHPLRREIIATTLTNGMINRVGVVFAHNIAEITGYDLADVVRAYIAVRDIYRIDSLWADIHGMDYKVSPNVQIHMIHALNRFIERAVIWFLRGRRSKQNLAGVLDIYRAPIAKIHDALEKILPPHDRKILDRKVADYTAQAVPLNVAKNVIYCRMLGGAGDVVNIAASLKTAPLPTAALYFDIGQRFGLDWMRRSASKLQKNSAWQSRAVSSLIDDLLGLQARLTKDIAKNCGVSAGALKQWINDHAQAMVAVDGLLAEIQAAPILDTAMITVAIAKIRTLLM